MELDTKSISILNKPPKTVIFRCLLTINHERQKPLFCPKTLARQALELQVFRPESLRPRKQRCRFPTVAASVSAIAHYQIDSRLKTNPGRISSLDTVVGDCNISTS